MRLYDDPVEVRKGPGGQGDLSDLGGGDLEEGPEQFLWRGRLWKVRAVLAHWVETGPWWQSAGVRAVVGTDEGTDEGETSPGTTAGQAGQAGQAGDLMTERELWRVEAGRGPTDAGGVFDLSFSWTDGRWLLVGCAD